jgi:uncharacterized protein (TIGR01777 family)
VAIDTNIGGRPQLRLFIEDHISLFTESSEYIIMKDKKIVIAGGSGFIGQALTARWSKENRVVILGRTTGVRWDGERVEPHWSKEIDGCDIVVNLAGRTVNCRYTRRNRKEILDSRLNSTKAIGQAVREATVPTKLWVNMSSATIYRNAKDRAQDEFTGEVENDFSVQVCKCWEAAFFGERTPFTRKVAIRTAITLGNGGALVPLRRLTAMGLGGRQGSGNQMFSWVHVEDIGRAIEWFLEHPELEGAFNICAPTPVTNSRFMAALRRSMGRRIGLPAPAWLLKVGAALIGTETELLLKSRWVLPTRIQQSGFAFAYPQLEKALDHLPH